MFRYYVKLGLSSIRKNPMLSALMVAAIAVGIGAYMTVINVDYVMSGNPIPHKSEVLFHVQVDNWDPNNAYEDPNEPPEQVTYLDGSALLAAGRAELNKAKRREIYAEMQRIVRDDGGSVIPMYASDLQAATDKLKFNKIAANWEFDGLKIAERWWFG